MKDPQAKKRARITAVALGASVVICLFFLMYAFVQKAAADKASEEAIAVRMLAYENAQRARRYTDETEKHARAMQQQVDECKKESAKKDSTITALRSKRK